MVEPNPFHNAGAERVNGGNGRPDHVTESVDVARVIEVGDHRTVVPVDGMKQQDVTFDPLVDIGQPATGVAGTWPLGLDHLWTEVGQPPKLIFGVSVYTRL